MEFQEQDWLEQELKSALARKDPPDSFAEAVAGKVVQQGGARAEVIEFPVRPEHRRVQRPVQRKSQRPLQKWLAAAAAVVLLAGGLAGYRRYEGEKAKREIMRAFFIAGGELHHVQTHLQKVSQ